MAIGVAFLLMLTNAVAQGEYITRGSATANAGNCFLLTPNQQGQGGWVWYQQRMSLQQNFDFTFTLNLGSNRAGADGIAFVLQPDSVNQGITGGSLGYAGISPSLAIEFDTYQNSDENKDPSFDHIAIQKNGSPIHSGDNMLAAPVQASASSVSIKDGQNHTARITWNVDTKTLLVYFNGSLRVTYSGDIVKDIFGGNPNVYWGFAGATGELHNQQSFCVQSLSFQDTIYVNAAATGSNTGTSWANAFTRLQDALQQAGCCPGRRLQIWVAKGTYYPDEGVGQMDNDRDASFALEDNVALYGGFAGTEVQQSQRNPQLNVTVLSGDLQRNDGPDFANNGDNAYHVVRSSNVSSTALLDGFTIQAGNASSLGGGMYNRHSAATITNCKFSKNLAQGGGAVFNDNGDVDRTITFTDCTFEGNTATQNGGGMYNSKSSPALIRCTFSKNTASQQGGGMFNYGSAVSLTNCIFSDNSAPNGGGVYNEGNSQATFLNSTFWGNGSFAIASNISRTILVNCTFSKNTRGAIFMARASWTEITNSVLWGDGGSEVDYIPNGPQNSHGSTLNVQYSIVQGGVNSSAAGPQVLNQDPFFVDAASGNLHLQGCSPAINAGDNGANGTAIDLDGNPRKVGTIDMGAYEFQGEGVLDLVLTSVKTASVCSNALFTYTATSSVEGTSFSWSRAALPGISNPAGSDTSASINETLRNTTSQPIDVVYVFTLRRGVCENKDSLKVTVNPTPAVAPISDTTFCNGALVQPIMFQSLTGNSTITWVSDAFIGFEESGSGNIPAFIASNPGSMPLTATVMVSISVGNCTGLSRTFRITVLPAPLLTSAKVVSVCNGALFNYTATSSAQGTSFSWTRLPVDSISTTGPSSGTKATISETLQNNATQAKVVQYVFTLSAGGACVSVDTVKVTINPTPAVAPISNLTVCNGTLVQPVVLRSLTGSATINWIVDTLIGFGRSGTGNIPTFIANNPGTTPLTATITVSPAIDGCTGPTQSFQITVLPAPLLTSAKTASTCNNALFTYTATSSAVSTVFSWSRAAVPNISNSVASGTLPTVIETLNNTSSQPVDVYYVFTLLTSSGCLTRDSAKVTVFPTAGIEQINDITVCNGQLVQEISFTSRSPGTSFSWINSNPAIGLPLGGNGSILGFIARNNTNNADTAIITVSAKTGPDGCTGLSRTFRIIVLPAPLLTSAKVASVCNGALFNYTATSSAVNTTFSWRRAAVPGISNEAAGGTSATISESLANTTLQPIEVAYVFALSARGTCESIDTLKVTVNPVPKLNPIKDLDVCNGNFVEGGIPLSSTTNNATFTWRVHNNPNIFISLSSSGSGSIPPFTPILNDKDKADSIFITVYALIGEGCRGDSQTVKITVRPGPALTSTKDTSICNNTLFVYKAESSANGTAFRWTRKLPDGISGTGPSSGTSASISDLLTNSGSQPRTVEYRFDLSTTTDSCNSTAVVRVTVNPTPVIDPIQNIQICNGILVPATIFSIPTNGAVFRWTNTDTTIGLPISGTDSIPAFIASNNTTVAKTANITVFVRVGTIACREESTTFQITVLPAPLLTSAKTASTCNNALFTYTATSSADNTTFSWSRAAVPGISSGPAVGTSATINELLRNTTPQPIEVVYVFTLSRENACSSRDSVRVTVNPIPEMNPVRDTTVCSGQVVGIGFTSPTVGVRYLWTNSDSSINLPAAGTGTLAFIAQNGDTIPVVATINVHPLIGEGCRGDSQSFRITVLPGPALMSTKDTVVCNDAVFNYTAISSAQGTRFSWSRAAEPGISNAATSDTTATIREALRNTTSDSKVVKYFFTLRTEKGCTSTYIVNVTVNPTPAVAKINDTTYCNSELAQPISFKPLTGNTSITWHSDTTIGFGTEGGGAIPAFLASNPGVRTLTATITYSTSIGACSTDKKDSFRVVVYPTPALTSSKRVSVCDNAPFLYTATSSAEGTRFVWSRARASGISNDAASGTSAALNERLDNTTVRPDSVLYAFRLTTGTTCEVRDTVKLIVNPTPVITTINDATFCNGIRVAGGIPFSSTSPDSSFTWTNSNPDIGLPVSGSGSIPDFVAVNKKNTPDTAVITVSITASDDNCKGKDTTFRIIVLPSPLRPSFISMFTQPDNRTLQLCSQSENINFSINSPVSGVRYRWRSNITDTSVLFIRDTVQPNTVISFKKPVDTARVTAIVEDTSTTCTAAVTQLVEVSSNSIGISKERIFVMQPGNLLVYPDNSLERYQWGYDSIIRTSPDTAYGPSTLFPGQTNQVFIPDARGVETTKYLYWVQLYKNGCTSRVYYNGPYRQQRRAQPEPPVSEVQLQLMPNPNNGLFEIALKGNIYGRMDARVYNSVGAVVFRKSFTKTIPVINEVFSTGHLPAGLYILEITSSDLKKVISRFVVQR